MSRNEQAKMNRGSSLFLITSGVCVGAAVAFGLWIMPSPLAQREIELDKQRVEDLIAIADAVLSYQRAKGKFPTALSALPEFCNASSRRPANEHSLRLQSERPA